MKFKRIHLTAAAFAAAAFIAGCGGSSSSGVEAAAAAPAGPVAGSAVGVLSDAVVGGVQYTTTSGVTGTTDAEGRYNYNPGDKVTFKVGSLTLGEVTASGLVTPVDLAAGNTAKLTNVLVLLQSLDSDGNPANGISIPAAAASALPSSLDLSTAFTATQQQALKTAMTAGGITGEPKSTAAAESHFKSQAATQISENVWVALDNGVPAFALRVQPPVGSSSSASFLLAEAQPSDSSGHAGVEYGQVTVSSVDARGFTWTTAFSPTLGGVDTNGEWGLSHPQASDRFRVTADSLVFSDNEGDYAFQKMDNDPKGIVGAWAFTGEGAHKSILLFFANGKMMFVDPHGSTDGGTCGDPGVEVGSYAYNTTSKAVTLSAPVYNTNGCAGLFDFDGTPAQFTWTVSADGTTAVMGFSAEDSITMQRISK